MSLPTDPVILLSFINTKLRDFYPDLDMLCNELELSKNEIENKLSKIDYYYEYQIKSVCLNSHVHY